MSDPTQNPYASPATAVAVPVEEPVQVLPPGTISLGARIAGAALLVNGVLVLIEKVMTKDLSNPGIGVIFDFGIGATLLAGKERYLKWAIIRAVLGGLVYTGLSVAKGDMVMGFIQICVSGALLALLLGNASKVRIGLASAVFAGYALLEMIGLATMGAH